MRDGGFFESASRYADAAAVEDPSGYTELAADISSLVESWGDFNIGLDEVDTMKMEYALDRVGRFNESLSVACGQIGVEVPSSE